ncbi:sensor histidine kinase [Ovoidimarina sediminis]|uniref:sensor histidine kinase n=1 Tax=Ovoidimarina sediminis TaxID=3079856 RepID=UPI00290F737A|nr:PAS domain-containing protein [Rhodophyticola sp. MJ-SS7]MDU8945865.1 PAS domain-containing protein [Rhodophyticola sp. MJ-SS7]
MHDISTQGGATGSVAELLGQAVEQSPSALLLFRPDERLTLLWRNPAHARMSASEEFDITGQGMFEAFPPSEDADGRAAMQAIRDSVVRIVKSGKPEQIGPYRYDLSTGDGRFVEHHWLIRMSPVSVNGEVAAILQLGQDVTQSVLDARLADSLKRAASSTAAVSYFSYDPETDRFVRSPAVDAMFGFVEGEAGDCAAPFFARVSPDDLPGVHAEVERVFGAPRGEIAAFDYRVAHADGSERFIRVRAEVATDPDDRREKLVGSFVDITDVEMNRRALEREVAFREALIKEANHRIKNSLAISLSMLRMERRSLEDIGDEASAGAADALAGLETRIGAISRAHGLMQLAPDGIDVSLHAMLTQLTQQTISVAGMSDEDLHLDIAGEDVQLDSDRATSLALILNELLTNSMKYGLDESGRAEIRISAKTEADAVNIAVSNIIETDQPIQPIPSTRLGATLVEQVASDLGADVEVDAGETHYTTRVWLPL